MKRTILTILGLALTMPLTSMAAPDFSGAWMRDEASSDAGPPELYWLTRGVDATGGRPPSEAERSLEVAQDGNKLTVTRDRRILSNHLNYMLDGKPHTVAMMTGMAQATVTASWKGDTLVINTVEPFGGMPGNATMQTSEVWSLSADGKVLTITTTRELPATTKTIKQVYRRQ